MSGKVRIGFVGCGYMGQKAHLDNFVTIPECEVVALAEGRQQTADLVARRYGIAEVYPDHRAMLAEAKIDAVVAIMGYHLHHAVVPDLLEAGKHVLTEKPMCIQAETGRRLASLARDKGLIYYVGYMKRSTPATQIAVRTIREWQRTGCCGRLTYLRASMPPGDWTFEIEGPLSAGDAPPAYEGITAEPLPADMNEDEADVYNAFVNYYIHQANLIRYLLGEDYAVEYADADGAVFVGRSPAGTTCVLEMPGYGLQSDWEETYRVLFERGKIELSIPAPMARQRGGGLSVFTAGNDRGNEVLSQPVVRPAWAFLEQARHFVRCVRREEQPWSVPEDAVKDLEVAEQYVQCRRRSLTGERQY